MTKGHENTRYHYDPLPEEEYSHRPILEPTPDVFENMTPEQTQAWVEGIRVARAHLPGQAATKEVVRVQPVTPAIPPLPPSLRAK